MSGRDEETRFYRRNMPDIHRVRIVMNEGLKQNRKDERNTRPDIICYPFRYIQMKIITRRVKHAFVLFQIIHPLIA